MQADRTDRVAGSVRGLGVCDVLLVEFEPMQREGLAAALAARTAAVQARRAGLEGDHELAHADDELRLLQRIGAGVPACAHAPFSLAGPAGLMLDLIAAALTAAVANLQARLGRCPVLCERELAAAGAWIATLRDCRAVEGYCFEPGVDPLHAR